jgi:DNA repair exonuclease SbcCD nuclease subunit
VTVFGHRAVETFPVVDDEGHQVAVVQGISHASRTVTENLALRFRRTSEPFPQFGLLHCNADQDPYHPAYAPCTLDDLRAAGMDYWALGHIHRHRVLSAGDPWVVYAGSLQGRSLKPGEVGVRGVVVGSVAGGRVSDIEFVPAPHVRFAELEVEIRDVADTPRLLDRMEEEAQAAMEEGLAVGLVARVKLVGRGPLHGDLAAPERLADLLKTMREEARERTPFLWWSGLVSATRPDLDRDAIRRRGDFSAELLQLTDRLREDEEALSRLAQQEEAALQAGGVRKLVARVQDEPKHLLDDAETLALERLEARSEQ